MNNFMLKYAAPDVHYNMDTYPEEYIRATRDRTDVDPRKIEAFYDSQRTDFGKRYIALDIADHKSINDHIAEKLYTNHSNNRLITKFLIGNPSVSNNCVENIYHTNDVISKRELYRYIIKTRKDIPDSILSDGLKYN